MITTQVYGLQMVTIPILASEHRADSLTVNHSRKVVPVWVSRVETILRQCAQQTTWPSQEFDMLKRQLIANRDADS